MGGLDLTHDRSVAKDLTLSAVLEIAERVSLAALDAYIPTEYTCVTRYKMQLYSFYILYIYKCMWNIHLDGTTKTVMSKFFRVKRYQKTSRI